jgi:hypothetical protein
MIIVYPAELSTVYGYSDISGTTNIIQILVPVSLYIMLWRKMKAAGAPGRNRPLFLAIGLILLIVAGIAAAVVTGDSLEVVHLVPASIILSAFAIFLVGITGYADKWLGTSRPEA